MQNGELARSTQRLIQMLRPEHVGTAAQAAMHLVQAARRPRSDGSARSRCGWREGKREVKRAQKLRYRVFYKDGTAIADAATLLARRDKDAFDRICDHLMVIDHAAKPSMSGKQPVVGTYRLLRQEVAEQQWRLLHRERVRHCRPDRSPRRFALSRTRTILRAAALPQQAHRRTAVARHLDLCPPAPARRDDRLRLFRGHRSRRGWRCRCRSCITTHRRRKPGAPARIPRAGSR